MLFEWLLTGVAENGVLFTLLAVSAVLGLGQLIYSVLDQFFRRVPIWLLVFGATVVTAIALWLPRLQWAVWVVLGGLAVFASFQFYRGSLKAKRLVKEHMESLQHHVVMIDQDGFGLDIEPMYDPVLGLIPRFRAYSKETFKVYIDNLLSNIQASKKSRLIIFIHGGLTDYQKALTLSKTRRDAMMSEDVYPIFILWRSGLVPCYLSHLTDFRQGRTPLTSRPFKVMLALTNLAADIGRGISRFFRTAYYQGLLDLSVLNPDLEHDATNVKEYYRLLRIRFCKPNSKGIRVWKKDDWGTRWEEGTDNTWLSRDLRPILEIFNPLKFAFRYAVWPFIDAIGTSAWDIMLRRTHTLFRSPYEFDVVAGTPPKNIPGHEGVLPYPPEPLQPAVTERATQMQDTLPSGALSFFIRALEARQLKTEVTLVGHSMGAIVVSRWLNMFPTFKAKEVVLMAAACQVADGLASLNSYLRRHTSATAHILTLHAKAERTEQHVFGLTPLGSLLEWIDNFFSKPLTFDQRTLGKWDNLLQSTHLIDHKLRSRLHLKCFSIRSDGYDLSPEEQESCKRVIAGESSPITGQATLDRQRTVRAGDIRPPVTHGDFSSCRFWQPAFYHVRDYIEKLN